MNSRRLSQKAAWACEYALDDRCRCRCGGKLHGAKRVNKSEHLAELPAGDPHHVPAKETFFRIVFSHELTARGRHRLLLECGHYLVIKQSRKIPTRAHCKKCRMKGRKFPPDVAIAPAIRFRAMLAHKAKRAGDRRPF